VSNSRPRAREIGIDVGIFSPGKRNAITDVEGVRVGHVTLREDDGIRTGVTVVLPHAGNIHCEKVPAGVFVGNGFGKTCGLSQVEEIGTVETPIALTNTLCVPAVAEALADYVLGLPGNEEVTSVNPVVGETNDAWLNDIRKRSVKKEHVLTALSEASSTNVEEGGIGAGTGTRCMGFKGGIGSSSRVLPQRLGGYTVGVLVQTNFGGVLSMNGAPVGRELGVFSFSGKRTGEDSGSCMIVVATDAPMSGHDLSRLARRAVFAMARVGASFSNGSGDYAICFSTLREKPVPGKNIIESRRIAGRDLSPLFFAVQEATEEAIYNSLLKAKTVTGRDGRVSKALPIERVKEICAGYGSLGWGKKLQRGEGVK